ncbi:hypothetical protein F9288_13795 [Sphingomonas sp. CL5.1]|uniref:hypothetical protein n=1 Tax=Sphingomonas sp. CL5.1 TaxID=2653203 RepID=UPI0015813E4A|nr:hypothetical protein [Sphingomonas sp. CL5.1]QKS00574.1 hypothetical protein F9288_13795 [Sphingomonas sp. CL5.1]
MTDAQVERLIDGWSIAMGGDFSILQDICSADCRIWHSSDDKWMPHREAMQAFNAAHAAGRIPPFENVRIVPTAKGFFCQAAITLDRIGKVHITQLVAVSDGEITEVEEYIAPEMDLAARLQA